MGNYKVKPYQKITIIYFTIGALWIFFSDRILISLASSTEILTTLQTYKGWFFVSFTSVLLFFLVKKDYRALEQREKEKFEIFRTTMSAVNHILNNFLHKMLFFKQIAVESKEFKEEVLEIYSNVITQTTEEIKKLGEIKNLSKEEIEKTVYPEKSR
jgi:hypothetical protein